MFHSRFWDFLLLLFFVLIRFFLSDAYDPMDPNGNVTIKWDIMEWHDVTYTAEVTINNFQLYRHVEPPGWSLGWAWAGNEVIWKMWGAEATEQGNCTKVSVSGENIPHCCEKEPVIIDLLPGAAYKDQYSNCCRGGVLSSITQNPTNSASSFRLVVGSAHLTQNALTPPENFTLGLPGYTCGPAAVVDATRFSDDGGRRWRKAIATWKVRCSYSQFRASRSPTCCVSMSSFYNGTIVPCPLCSCSCQGPESTSKCIKSGQEPKPQEDQDHLLSPVVRCTEHMCPIRVHWHVKVSYKQYWRVKMTVTNFNYVKNYSEWNLVVQHPNLQSVEQVFSFNYKPLHQYANINDAGMFWGVQYYNDMLIQAGKLGNVQTELLLKKEPGVFTFNQGWAFPRKISFNGDECVMPPPDAYPMLPNGSPTLDNLSLFFFLLVLYL